MFDVYEQSQTVELEDVSLCVTDHGPSEGVPVVLLHGWPDSALLWRHQIPVLAEAGYRVIAPDLRGFGRSDRPYGVAPYAMQTIIGDIVGVLTLSGIERAHVVGHDFGAAVAWQLALRTPAVVRSLTALSLGHPAAYAAAGMEQREKAWYQLLFQFEGIAEQFLSNNNWAMLDSWLGRNTDRELWVEDLVRPGALTASLNWYRANLPPESLVAPKPEYEPVEVDTLGIWSTDDVGLVERGMQQSGYFVGGDWRYERLEGVSHWIPVDAPDRLNDLLLEWLADR